MLNPIPNPTDRCLATACRCHLLTQFFPDPANQDNSPLASASPADRALLVGQFVGLLQQLSRLMRVPGEDPGMPSLGGLLRHLMEITTEILNADRSTLFLYDPETGELFSRIAQGDLPHEIRFPVSRGIAGAVFRTGQSMIIADAYLDPRFNPEIDEQTGYHTQSLLCVPIRSWDNRIIGVTEALNKQGGFTAEDMSLLDALTNHAAPALESAWHAENLTRALRDEAQLLDVTIALSSELKLDALLTKIIDSTTKILEADRSTLLLYDEATHELHSQVAQGLEMDALRIPADLGIAGAVFTAGETINIPNAYADPRFNREVDQDTGYTTHSILCVPVFARMAENQGIVEKKLGVIQVLNKRGGPFTKRDESRLQALASQAAIAIENARLFEEVDNARQYSESILGSLGNGVITLDKQRCVTKANPAAHRILGMSRDMRGLDCRDLFRQDNRWILDVLDKSERQKISQAHLNGEIRLPGSQAVTVNLNAEPLIDGNQQQIGHILILDDITAEKRLKGVMTRYMSRELADQLLESNEASLGGQEQRVTVLFSDITNFTGLTERLGARGTVSMLNEYFSEMAELVLRHHGVLDKYLGDAIMAVFGTPFPHLDDPDNALRVAVDMLETLKTFNTRRAREGHSPIQIRLGIGTGEVIVGNIGSPRRMDYTVVGHTVNVARRLESINLHYGTRILLTESTLSQVREPQWHQWVRELDLIRVKGSSTPVAIYELLKGRLEHPWELIECFKAGLACYRDHQWRKAADRFQRALTIWPEDGPSRLYLQRCADHLTAPPPPDWDGIWNMSHK